jgi:Putative Ig domain
MPGGAWFSAMDCTPVRTAAGMSGPSFVGSTYGGTANSVSRTPAAGNDLILQIIAYGAPAALSTVTDSTGATVEADFAFTLSGQIGIGVYRVHNATAVNHTLTVSWSTAPSTGCYVTLSEASNVAGVDTAAGTPALATGNSVSPTTGTLDPLANGDLFFAALGINHFLSSLGSLTNGFTQTQVDIAGPSFIEAYLSQPTAASVNCGATANSAFGWVALLIAYKGQTLTLSPTTLPGGTVGDSYDQTITAAGGTAPYAFTVTSGTPPPGLTLSGSGVLSGTPTTAGSYSFTVQGEDANGYIGTQPYSNVTISNPTPTIAPSTLGPALSNQVYTATLSASGGFAPYTFAVSSGTLPPGLTLWPTGKLAGPPLCPGTWTFAITATDARGNVGTQSYSFIVTVGPPYNVALGWGWPCSAFSGQDTGRGRAPC